MKTGSKLAGALALVVSGALALWSEPLQQHLGRWEGEGVQVVYADRLAGGLPTVCKGITKYTSPVPVVVGEYWSPAKCEEIELAVVSTAQKQLAACFRVPISQPMFDAFSSHAHNFGVPSTCGSRAVALVNAGLPAAGCRAIAHAPNGLPVWPYVTNPNRSKRFVRGRYNRRLAEVDLCLSGGK